MIGGGHDSGIKKSNTINRRMFIFAAAKAVVFFGIVGRLFSLQINENKKYLTLSDKNRLREARLPPVRGEFVDYFGNRIAKNLTVYQLHVVPEQVEDFKTLIVRLKDILNLSNNNLKELIKKKNKQKPWETLIVSENLTWDEFSKINFYLHELSGARPVLTVGRNYPYNEIYTHVLGYVSEASVEDLINNETIKQRNVPGLRVGKTGLEKALEKELIGTNGVQRFEVNAYGKRINQIDFKEGDYFSYGAFFFEATSIIYDKLVYGHIERVVSLKVLGKQSRIEHIDKIAHGPTSESYTESDAVKTTFEQQRGMPEHDVRQLVEDKVLEKPITGAKKVAPDGTVMVDPD